MPYEQIFLALSDPTRRAIFEALRAGPLAVGALAAGQGVSGPAVSQHLKVLATAGLVRAEARGTARHYHALPEGLEALRDYVDGVWGNALVAFAAEVEKQQGSD